MARTLGLSYPIGITMWDFSWLERRWAGAGYEDWDEALRGLIDRGYEAVRIDPYPHLLREDPLATWELLPEWTTNDWGAPGRCRIQVWPALHDFLKRCREYSVRVALSSWFRQDVTGRRLELWSPEQHGRAWRRTLELIDQAGLLDTILYVDLCNEWPLEPWAPYFPGERKWDSLDSSHWREMAMEIVRTAFPQIPLTFSNTTDARNAHIGWGAGSCDLLEPHIWMATASDFYDRIGYAYERFDLVGYRRVVDHAYDLFASDPTRWIGALDSAIAVTAEWGRQQQRPLVTTECWALVDYKDWPMLEWDWIKDLCAHGVRQAAQTGAWACLATSNFCGPQFRGMWRDVMWHRRLNNLIRSSRLPTY